MSEQPATPPAGVPEWDVADRMRKALRHADLGVQEIADYMGVSRNTVSTWINGRIDPSTQTLRLWAMRCGVSYEWLSDGADAISPGHRRGQRRQLDRIFTGRRFHTRSLVSVVAA